MAKSRSGRSKKRRFTEIVIPFVPHINENDETSELNSTESASAKKLAKLCAFLGLPFLSKLAFRNQERKLLKATERVAQENINAALSEIKGSNSFTKCGISIDGTWQTQRLLIFEWVWEDVQAKTENLLKRHPKTSFQNSYSHWQQRTQKCVNAEGSLGCDAFVNGLDDFEADLALHLLVGMQHRF
ncbi:hypothetical protein TNCV_661141 [Trichonephila clavipes]|nr:hypothetical protein TNCV_661141 [Trichonephila clavipes]